jgi:hypothetical protein
MAMENNPGEGDGDSVLWPVEEEGGCLHRRGGF